MTVRGRRMVAGVGGMALLSIVAAVVAFAAGAYSDGVQPLRVAVILEIQVAAHLSGMPNQHVHVAPVIHRPRVDPLLELHVVITRQLPPAQRFPELVEHLQRRQIPGMSGLVSHPRDAITHRFSVMYRCLLRSR